MIQHAPSIKPTVRCESTIARFEGTIATANEPNGIAACAHSFYTFPDHTADRR